jgi:hypothetical protein
MLYRISKPASLRILEEAGYVREGKVRADLLWQDLKTAKLSRPLNTDADLVGDDWRMFAEAEKWLTFDKDGLYSPRGHNKWLAGDKGQQGQSL